MSLYFSRTPRLGTPRLGTPQLGTARLLLLALALVSQWAFAVNPVDSWKDSYSYNGQCYCVTTFDHEIGPVLVDTPQGPKTVVEICNTIGAGPGAAGNPVYNDVQCGNGPANNAVDETVCPGRVDQGDAGCSIIGPTWNLEQFFPSPDAETLPPTEPEEPAVAEPAPPPAPAGALFEAETFNSADIQWVLIKSTDDYSADPFWTDSDAPHTTHASGGLYVEVLPDKKVSETDSAEGAVWPVPGEGPQIHYAIQFPAAGRYEVTVKGYSTGAHDNQVHVGLDGSWPDSGKNIQFCGPKNQWSWSGCEGLEQAWLDVPSAGFHALQFSAFEDGFEMDQFVLTQVEVSEPAAPETETPTQGGNTETSNQPATTVSVPSPEVDANQSTGQDSGVETGQAPNPATQLGTAANTATSTAANSSNGSANSSTGSSTGTSTESDALSPDSTEQLPDPELGEAISVGGPVGYGAGEVNRSLLVILMLMLLVRFASRGESRPMLCRSASHR